jgi:hypothetical protein
MNGTAPTIEIIGPFRAAYDWMKIVLFRPFDVAKWLTIAFAAFIAGAMGGGGGGSFSRLGRLGNGDWKYSATRHGDLNWNAAPWIIAAIIAFAVFIMLFVVVWMWVSSRGRFIFTDCVVRNRGAIGEPWREYRREGNSFFLFSLLVGFGMFVILAIAGLLIWLCFFGMRDNDSGPGTVIIIGIALMVLIWIAFSLCFAVISAFMIPVMYRRRCLAREAFVDVAKLIGSNPVPFILFVLFQVALAIGVAIIGAMVACFTCCIGGLPYISTVLLLPAIVWLAAYKLLFLRQFGDAYDAWAAVVPPPPPEPLLPPPNPAV